MTTYTTDLIELSKQAAEALGVPEKRSCPICIYGNSVHQYNIKYQEIWLAEDSGRCAEIANSRRLDTINLEDAVVVEYDDETLTTQGHIAFLSDHQGDRNAAWRVAVLRAVIEQRQKEWEN